jgi:hypothetical protein
MNILLDESDPPALDSGTISDADTVSHVESRSHSDSSDSEPLGEYQSDSDIFVHRPRSGPRRYRHILPRSGFTMTVDNSDSPEEGGTERRSSSASSLSAPDSAGASEELSRSTTSILEAARRFDGISSSSRSDERMTYSDWRATLSVAPR